MNFLCNRDEFISCHGFIWVCVYGCLCMVRWQQSKNAGRKNQMDELASRPIYYVGYSPSISLC